ncbi:putative HTH-type transcriptional regulator [Paenibacillus nuruki]|uniref:Putative HTH-type transcriptional regulator n=1 Tax=Paenibacillus nuruki TaxID=1886670 RepID=A0A1E3L698_9BACL|nr:helix-turn-helix transcriptional regulator [Paenibacillus nuruki]ODP28500.1 putative HTH-type transcriptional regulator [Paenibacillus nuruki]
MDSIQTIGESVRFLRQQNGLSQEQLALISGINTSYVGQIERGEKNPTIKTLEKIAYALKTTVVDLLTMYDPVLKYGSNTDIFDLIFSKLIKQCLLEVLIENTNLISQKKDFKIANEGENNNNKKQ